MVSTFTITIMNWRQVYHQYITMGLLAKSILLIACLSFISISSATSIPKSHRLALLIAAPWEGQVAMHNDLVAIDNALRERGYSTGQIRRLEGKLNRKSLLSFIQKANRRIAGWDEGEVFLYFGGNGFYSGSKASEAQPGLLLMNDPQHSPDSAVFWKEVFTTLNVPANVKLIVLPDT